MERVNTTCLLPRQVSSFTCSAGFASRVIVGICERVKGLQFVTAFERRVTWRVLPTVSYRTLVYSSHQICHFFNGAAHTYNEGHVKSGEGGLSSTMYMMRLISFALNKPIPIFMHNVSANIIEFENSVLLERNNTIVWITFYITNTIFVSPYIYMLLFN